MIFHVFGTMCAGKSTAIEYAQKKLLSEGIKLLRWDVKDDFYLKYKVIDSDGDICWDTWNKHIHKMIPELTEFLESNPDNHKCIETSGMNRTINLAIKKFDVIPICLKTPTYQEIKERALARDVEFGTTETLYTANNILQKYSEFILSLDKYLPERMDYQHAADYIVSRIKEEI